jgi:hypothetical protein
MLSCQKYGRKRSYHRRENVVIICIICKKGNVMICDNYRAVTLLCTTCKVLANILYLKLCSEEILRESHGGFSEREGQLSIKCFAETNIVRAMGTEYRCTSTVYQFFKSMWHCMEKGNMKWNAYIRYPRPRPLLAHAPQKIVKLCRILNNEIYAKVKIGKHLSSCVLSSG